MCLMGSADVANMDQMRQGPPTVVANLLRMSDFYFGLISYGHKVVFYAP